MSAEASGARQRPAPNGEHILRRFRAGENRDAASLDFGHADLLAALNQARGPDQRFDFMRLRSWFHHLRLEPAEALAGEREVFAARPTAEALKNIGVLARRAGERETAVDFLVCEAERFADSFELYAVLAHNCGAFGDLAAAKRYGTLALRLKDSRVSGRTQPALLPAATPFDPGARSRNVIAFSLFGDNPRYLQPLLASAEARVHLYPLWTIRVYVDASVPDAAARKLQEKGCQLMRVEAGGVPGTFWRFLVAEDKSVARFLVRDADSVLNIRERVAVDAWLASERHFHVMRDFYSHTELILAGLWGGVGGVLPVSRLIREWRAGRRVFVYNDSTADQTFLREKVWPLVRGSVLVHDSVFDFEPREDFPPVGTLPPHKHVGQDDFMFFKRVRRAPASRQDDGH